MANALWLSPYWSDLATISASTTAGTLVASNMQNYEPKRVWRSAGGSGSYIDLDFGAGGAIAPTAVALIGTNLGASDTMSIFGSNTSNAAARAGAATSTGNAYIVKSTESGWPYHIAFRKFTNASSLRYWSITFPSVAGSSIDVGRLMLGAHFTPTINLPPDGFAVEYVSADMTERTDYNKAMIARRGNAARRFLLQYNYVNHAEAQRGFGRLGRLRGNGGDFFFSLDPDDTTYFPEYSGQFTIEQLSMPSVPFFDGSGQMWAMRASLLEVV